MNCDDVVLEYGAKCKETTGYAWERTLRKGGRGRKKEILDLFYYPIFLLRHAQREPMLIKELRFVCSGYLRFNFGFIEKNNSIL